MAKKKDVFEKVVEIPEGVTVEIKGEIIKEIIARKGDKENRRTFDSRIVDMEVKDNKIIIRVSKKLGPKKKMFLNTWVAHVKNLLRGLIEPFVYKLKIVYSHFPMKVKIEGDKVIIENFMGCKKERVAKIYNSKVTINKDIIIVESTNIEDAGKTASAIEQATRIKRKDLRKFQDGIYIIEKAGKKV